MSSATSTFARTTSKLSTARTDRNDRDQRTEACFEKMQDATPAEREALESEIISLNIDFADRISLRFQRRGVDREDLVQIGRAALVAAMRRYRPGSGRNFTSFAGPTIRGELKHYFRDATWSVRPPRRLQELRADVRESRERLEQDLGRTVTHADVAADLDLPETAVRECVCAEAAYHSRSLDAPTRDAEAGSAPLSDMIAADGDEFARIDDMLSVQSAMAHLDDRERQILWWRYVEGCTQAEIGERLGVSQMQVSRLHRAILERLREHLEHEPEAAPKPAATPRRRRGGVRRAKAASLLRGEHRLNAQPRLRAV